MCSPQMVLSDSEGTNDDLNKAVWSGIAANPRAYSVQRKENPRLNLEEEQEDREECPGDTH